MVIAAKAKLYILTIAIAFLVGFTAGFACHDKMFCDDGITVKKVKSKNSSGDIDINIQKDESRKKKIKRSRAE